MIQSKKTNKKDILFLIVENDLKWRKKIIDFLRFHGYKNIIDADDGTIAWHKLKRFDVDFVVCGWNLKHMNGLALLKIMMSDEIYCSIPFLMICDVLDKNDVMEAAKAGVSGLLIKPFNPEKFIDKIKSIVDEENYQSKDEIKELFELGKKYLNEGLYEKALKIYNKILEFNDEAEAYYHIGYIKQAQGNLEEAATAFRKAIQVNTAFVKAFEALGSVYKNMGESKESEKYYEKAGDLYLKQEMLEEAEEVYKEANSLNPQNVNIFNSLGIVYRRRGQHKEAILEYKKGLKVDPKDEHIHYNIARAYLEAKQVDQARKHLEKAITLNPYFKEAITILKAISLGFAKS